MVKIGKPRDKQGVAELHDKCLLSNRGIDLVNEIAEDVRSSDLIMVIGNRFKEEVRKLESKYPIEFIGAGSYRVVVKLPDRFFNSGNCIVKISGGQPSQTAIEAQNYLLLKEKDRTLLNKYAHVMQVAEDFTWLTSEFGGADMDETEVWRWVEENIKDGIYYFGDAHPENIKIVDGKRKIIDYGSQAITFPDTLKRQIYHMPFEDSDRKPPYDPPKQSTEVLDEFVEGVKSLRILDTEEMGDGVKMVRRWRFMGEQYVEG